ncbi:MAG: Ig-like domain-containing protein [Gemmatimonadaceae bacterium]
MHTSVRTLGRAVALLAFTTLSSCSGGGGDGPITAPPTAASVELSSTTLDLVPNGTSQLTATARASSGAALTGRAFTWGTASSTVATVSGAGLVTGVADGTTTVSVTVDGKSASATVNVRTPVAAVTITPGTAQVTVGGATSQLTAVARDANGVALSGRAIIWGTSNVAIASVTQTGVVTGVAPGAVTISATSEGRSGTAAVTVLTPDPCLTIRNIGVGQTFSGALVAADCRLGDNSTLQYFTFTLAAQAVLEIEMTSTAVDAYLFVADANFNTLVEDDDGGPTGTNARVLRAFPAGKYYVAANAYDANSFGAYQLSVKLAPPACTTGRATTLPTILDTALAIATSCRLNDDSYVDRYDLAVAARTTVRMDMISSVIDSYLLLLDAHGKLVAQDDDAGAGVNAHIEVQLEAGRYSVLANAAPGQTGAYRIEVAAAVDPCAVTRAIGAGQTVAGTLVTADCSVGLSGPIPYTQRYLLNVTTAGPLQIDMTSTAVDAYLILQNAANGAILGENDDVAVGVTNARIAGNFAVGQYIVNATTYDFNQTGNYSLSVTPIVPATPVGISVNVTTLALASGAQQQLTATITGSTNTAVTWLTSSTSVATVTAAGLVRAVTPGTATITVRSAADPSRTATITVTVSQQQNGTPNIDIGAMYLIQSVQQLDGSVKLVANRAAVARVYVRGSRTGISATVVRLRAFEGNTLLQTFEANVTPALTIDESCCSANIAIPANLIRAGVSIVADADPNNLIVESNETDNSFPLNGTPQPLNVVTVADFNVRLVPIRQNRTGQTGVVNTAVVNTLKSVWPLGTVNITTRATLAMDYTLNSTSFDEWSLIVRDLELVRRSESSNMYYYGMVRVNYTSGVLGLAGGIPALSAVGIDEGTPFGAAEAKVTLAHEMGHTMGLRHAPCGGAAGPDPAFLFTDGRSGAFGMDLASGNVIKVPSGTDIMGYCENQWVSVYNYRNVFELRARNPNGAPAALAATGAATTVLMVTGAVDAREVRIDGSFAITASANRSDANGRFVLEGFAENGKLLFSHRFTPFAVSDGKPDQEAFVVGVPVSETVRSQVARMAVREVSGSRSDSRNKNATLAATSSGNSAVFSAVRSTAGTYRLQWSKSAAPMVMIRNPSTNEILGIGRTGDLDLSQFDSITNVELLFSDGVSSIRRSANTKTGVIRQ